MEYFERINVASFCGQVFDVMSGVVIADPLKTILNFPWVNMKFAQQPLKTRLGLARCKALSLLYQHAGCPILQPYALMVLRICGSVDYVFDTTDRYKYALQLEAFNNGAVSKPITDSCRSLFAGYYNMSVFDQLDIERAFDLNRGFEFFDCPTFLRLTSPVTKDAWERYVKQIPW